MVNLKNLDEMELNAVTEYFTGRYWELLEKNTEYMVFNTFNDRPSKSKDPAKQAENDIVNIYTMTIDKARKELAKYVKLEIKGETQLILRFYPRKSDFATSRKQTTKTELDRIAKILNVTRGEAFEALLAMQTGCIDCIEDWQSADTTFYNDDRLITPDADIFTARGFKSTLCDILTIINKDGYKMPVEILEILKKCEYID